jgi:hypothetical protein
VTIIPCASITLLIDCKLDFYNGAVDYPSILFWFGCPRLPPSDSKQDTRGSHHFDEDINDEMSKVAKLIEVEKGQK